MLGQYLPLLMLFGLAVAFAAGSFIASGLLAPRNPTQAKRAAYECGIVPTKETPERFPVKFFLVAMIFIVFDIEIIFFYPYALAYGSLGVFGLVTIMVFTFAVFESFVYLISNGALEWGPLKQVARPSGAVTPERTAESTIRRVGLENRPIAEETAA
ncbi:MAG: NADH-quinone oxidoreductase subunit A [Actinomycetota bacterium]